MTTPILILLFFAGLDLVVLSGRTPDTHREETQHGDFRF